MLKWKHRAVRYESGPNLTPLVDVVLVVLIFLMLVGAMAAPRVLSARTPAIGSGHGPQPMSMELRVREDPASGTFIITGSGLQIVGDSGQLLPALQGKMLAYKAAGIDPSEVQLVIRPARDVTYQHVLSVYETAQRARFTRVALGATK
jgi:biopolymer transport protein ExbD